DNDLDGDTDCEDSDCPASAACPDAEVCDDEIDNDFDGDTDCEDSDCTDAIECNCVTEVRGGECVEESDGTFPGAISYIRNIQIPPRGTDAECCFDFDDDGDIDNGLGLLVGALGALGQDLDIEATIEEALAGDSIALLLEWGRGAEGNGFWAYLGSNDTDADGEPDQSYEDRSAGDGVFQIQASSLDEYGSIIQFNTATVDGDVTTAGPSIFALNIPIETDGFSLDLDLTIERATIQGITVDDATGVASVDEEFDIDGENIEYGGWALGGVVPLDQIGALLDDLMSDCACAGFDADLPVVTYGDDGTTYNLACAQSPEGECTADDGVICENVSLVCSFLPSLPSFGLNDIDTNGNGVGDALSVGIRLSAVGAVLAEIPVQD
ncbi:MAG: hypothetical protein ACJAYU_002429, partial [Bradymonadia bacterium]